MSGGGKVHRGGVAYTAAEAARRRKRPCASAPAVPANVRIDWKKRHQHHERVFNAHVKWDAVTQDVASRPITPEIYQVQLQATDASGEAIETQDQLEAANSYGSDWSLVSGSAPVTLHHRTLSGAGVIETPLTGLTAGLSARANFYLRKASTGGTVKCEVWNSTDGVSVISKNSTPSMTAKPDTTASMAFTPVTGKSYKARVTWVSGTGSVLVDTVQWHTNGDTATWVKTIHYPDNDAHFQHVVRPDTWYYQARVRVMNRVHDGKCWSAWSAWSTTSQPATGEPTGPPAPDGLSLSFDRVEGHRADPWRARVSFNEVGPFVAPDGDAQDGARHYHIQLQMSNDAGTNVANTRRRALPAEPDQAKLHADFFRIHGKRKYRARVRSVGKHGVLGAWSAFTAGWHGPNGAPTDVTSLTWSNPTPAHLVAKWSEPTDPTDAYRYHVQVIRTVDSVVVDDGYTAGTRWRYDIPTADRTKQHRVKVIVEEAAPTLDADADDGASGSIAYDTPDVSTGSSSTDVSNTNTWSETDIVVVSKQISDGIKPASSPTPTVLGGPGYLSVKWPAVANVDQVTYDVYVSATDLGSAASSWTATTPVGSVQGTLFFIKALASGTALAYGTTYFVAVVARDADGTSTAALTRGSGAMVKLSEVDVSVVAAPISDGVKPATSPTPVVTSGIGYIAASWTAVANVDAVTYDVYCSATDLGATASAWTATTKVGSVNGTAFIIKNTGAGVALAYGTTYFVAVVARDADGASTAALTRGSGAMAATVPVAVSDGVVPSASPTPSLVGGPGYLAASWLAVTNVDAVTYDVYCSTTDLGSTVAAWTATTKVGSINGTSFIVKNTGAGAALVYGTTYFVAVIARDVDGTATAALTRASGAMSAITAVPASDGAVPTASPTPVLTAGPGYLAAAWTAVANTDPVTYDVYCSATDLGSTVAAWTATTKVGSISGTSFIVKNTGAGVALAYGTTYFVAVIARDQDGTATAALTRASGAMSAITSTPASDGAVPASSPTPTVTGGVGFISAVWTAVANTDPVTYDVYVSASDLGSTVAAWTATTPVGSIDGTAFVAKALSSGVALAYGTTYFVAVIARDHDGRSTAALTRGSAAMVPAGTADIAANAVTAAKIAANTITAAQIAANTITAGQITAGTITATEIAANAITTTQLNAGAVTAAKIAANTITAAQITAGTITATEIAANAITTTQLNALAVTAAKIAANTITAGQIAANTITAAQIAANTITAGQITAGTITATEIAANAITTTQLNALAVTAAKIAANTITASQIAANTITAAQIAASTITAAQIATDTITATQIAADAITSSELATGSVIAGKIAAGIITATELATDSVTSTQILAGAVTTAELAAGAVTAVTIAANAIDGMTITGATLQTSDGNVVIDNSGVHGYNPTSGAPTFSLHNSGAAEFAGAVTGGLIAIAPSVGAAFTTNFGANTLAATPSDWTANDTADAAHWTVQAKTSVSGHVFTYSNTGAAPGGFGYHPTTEASVLNAEVYANVRFDTLPTQYDTWVLAKARGSGTLSSQTAYTVHVQGSFFGAPTFSIGKMQAAGSPTAIATIPLATLTPTVNTFYKIRFRVVGTSLFVKIWLASASEPKAWTASVADADIQTAGYVGASVHGNSLFAPSSRPVIDWQEFKVTVLNGGFNVDSTGNMWMGAASPATAPFAVTAAGVVTAASLKDPLGHPFPRWAGGTQRTIDADNASGTTDGSGLLVVSHGVGATPLSVVCTSSNANGREYRVTATSSTTFTVEVRGATGSVLASTAVSFYWMALG